MADEQKVTITDEQAKIIGKEIGRELSYQLAISIKHAVHGSAEGYGLRWTLEQAVSVGFDRVVTAIRQTGVHGRPR